MPRFWVPSKNGLSGLERACSTQHVPLPAGDGSV